MTDPRSGERRPDRAGGGRLGGLDRTYVGGIERVERNVALRNVAVIAEAFGLTLADLMRGV